MDFAILVWNRVYVTLFCQGYHFNSNADIGKKYADRLGRHEASYTVNPIQSCRYYHKSQGLK